MASSRTLSHGKCALENGRGGHEPQIVDTKIVFCGQNARVLRGSLLPIDRIILKKNLNSSKSSEYLPNQAGKMSKSLGENLKAVRTKTLHGI